MTLFRSILVFAIAYLLTACGTRPPVVVVEPEQPPPLEPETPPPLVQPVNFAEWQQAFAQRAAAAGIADSDIQQLLARTHYEEKVVSADRKQPELNKMVWAYLDNAVSNDRIQKGRAQLSRYRSLLQQIEAQTGVGASYIVAFWGMESAYGANTGNIDLIQALSTLAYEGRRRDFAEQQLIALLQLIERGDVSWDELRGSWAGGMGHTQFIPTTFLQYGVDGNGDGRRDPWQIEDALASTANYLSKSGWQRGHRWGREVSLAPDFDYRYTDQSLPLAQWSRLGAPATAVRRSCSTRTSRPSRSITTHPATPSPSACLPTASAATAAASRLPGRATNRRSPATTCNACNRHLPPQATTPKAQTASSVRTHAAPSASGKRRTDKSRTASSASAVQQH